jgi:hypothetical protein
MNLLVKVITNLDCEQFGKINIRDKISKHEIICLMNALVKVMTNLDCEQFGKITIRDKISKHEIIYHVIVQLRLK